MFQFRRFPAYSYLIHCTLTDSSSAGFPHSDIHGSQAAFASPWLFVDRYVLLRLLVPRHSPYALSSLTIFSRSTSLLHWTHLRLFRFQQPQRRTNEILFSFRSHAGPMLESIWFFGFSLDDKIIVVFTLKYFYHFTFTCALFSFQGTFFPYLRC